MLVLIVLETCDSVAVAGRQKYASWDSREVIWIQVMDQLMTTMFGADFLTYTYEKLYTTGELKCMPKNKCANQGKQFQWPKLEDTLETRIEDQR